MAEIVKNSVIQQIVDRTGLQIQNGVPKQLSNQVSPTLEINPVITSPVIEGIYNYHSIASSASDNIKTLDSGKDFYLTSVSLGFAKDVVCDASTGYYYIRVTTMGSTKIVASLPVITLTAESRNLTIDLGEHPIKCDKNTNITLVMMTHTAGVFVKTANVTGFYLVD